jgi:hypothetical protein
LLSGSDGAKPTRPALDIEYRVVEEIVDLVESECLERPILLVAEDIHWADTGSLLALLSLARQIPLAPLCLVVTARPSPPPEAAQLLEDLAASGAHTLRLQPLGQQPLPEGCPSHLNANFSQNPLGFIKNLLNQLIRQNIQRGSHITIQIIEVQLLVSLRVSWHDSKS